MDKKDTPQDKDNGNSPRSEDESERADSPDPTVRSEFSRRAAEKEAPDQMQQKDEPPKQQETGPSTDLPADKDAESKAPDNEPSVKENAPTSEPASESKSLKTVREMDLPEVSVQQSHPQESSTTPKESSPTPPPATAPQEPSPTPPAEPQQSTDQQNCPVCQRPITNRAVMDPCFHALCLPCVVQLIHNQNRCPVCHTRVNVIMHNIRSAFEYDTLPLPGVEDNGRAAPDPGERTANDSEIRPIASNETFPSPPRRLRRNDELRRVDSDDSDDSLPRRPEVPVFEAPNRIPGYPELERSLINEPELFVTVNAGRPQEYLLPITSSLYVLTNEEGLDLLNPNRDETANQRYVVRHLEPNLVVRLTREEFSMQTQFVSPNLLQSFVQAFENQAQRYQRQLQEQRQQQHPQEQSANRENRDNQSQTVEPSSQRVEPQAGGQHQVDGGEKQKEN